MIYGKSECYENKNLIEKILYKKSITFLDVSYFTNISIILNEACLLSFSFFPPLMGGWLLSRLFFNIYILMFYRIDKQTKKRKKKQTWPIFKKKIL